MNLLTYIQGSRKGKEAHRIEKEAMQDPFLTDALEGFDEVKGDHIEQIAHLRNRIRLTTGNVRYFRQKKLYIGIAASLLFCLVVGGYFLLDKKPENLIAMHSEVSTVVYENEMEITGGIGEAGEGVEAEKAGETAETFGLSVRKDIQNDVNLQTVPVPVQDKSDENITVIFVEEEDDRQAMVMVIEREDIVDEEIVSALQAETNDNAAIVMKRDEEADAAKTVATLRARGITMEAAQSSEPLPEIGIQAYEQYLKEAMILPENEACSQTNGIVEVAFTLQEGKPAGFVIKQSFCDAASKEAIRLIENGSKWIGEEGQTVVLKVNF